MTLPKVIACYSMLAILLFLPASFLYLDIAWFANGITEVSVTEISQSVLLLLCCFIFLHIAENYESERGFAILAMGLFFCMFIREQNNLFKDIQHGLWQILVLIIALGAVLSAYRHGPTAQPLRHFLTSPAGAAMAIRLTLLLVFSRTFGMQILWRAIFADEYVRVAKNAVEEGTETMAYIVIFFASQMYRIQLARGRLPT